MSGIHNSFTGFIKRKRHSARAPDDHSGRGGTRALSFLLSAAAVILAGILVVNVVFDFTKKQQPSGKPSASVSTASLSIAAKPKNQKQALTTEQAAAKILPCVVGIVQYQTGSLKETGEGSGIIMSAGGLIINNNHVIEGAGKLEVVLRSSKKYVASVIGSDTRTDLAVIKIDAQKLPYAQFGDSDSSRVGEKVIAVGNPSGLQLAGSVTQGIISALNRNVDVGNGPMNLIQTDAAINPGNSGGALVNMYGQVIGINSAKIAQAGYEGLGFSIPIKTAKPVVDSILKYGFVQGRVKFGLSCQEIDSMTAQMNDIPVGIYVKFVEPDSSAGENGILADDIITAIDGKAVTNTENLITERDKHKAGDEVTLTVFRRSAGKTLSVKVALLEDKGSTQASDAGDW
jgi:serine protease Do